MTIINTNARSLAPKIDSLLDCFSELEADLAVITETWLRDGPELERDLQDLDDGAGVLSLTKNREPNPSTGTSHGGVAIMYKKRLGRFKEIPVANPDKFEVLPAVGTIMGSSRKMVVVAAYIPPNYTASRGAACLAEGHVPPSHERAIDPLSPHEAVSYTHLTLPTTPYV